ncbi:hypothetical protein [Thiolapillus sp.]|uniref:hypothetical protein n=1 Tax=Thiolapillus sp. TaxID=2017437 RepID=UPI003AF9F439
MKHMKHYTILTPDAAAALINSNDEFRGAVRKTLSTQIVYSLDSILRGAWYDPSIETLVRITDIASSVMKVYRSKIEGVESIIVPLEVAAWLKKNHDKFFAVAHYVDCSRGALYHYEKTGRDTLSYSITAGVSDFIRDQDKIREKQDAL